MPEKKNIVAVIMAGGAGTRFWPLSTRERPKQFIALFGQRTLIQMSVDRLKGFIDPERIFILTNADHVSLTRDQLPEIPGAHVIGEPVRRDTAAAVTLAAVILQKRFDDPVILTLTADHLIEPPDVFQVHLASAAAQAAVSPVFYTFGIPPTSPATVYGYLEKGNLVLNDSGIEHFELRRFKEKPDIETARHYLASGRFLWNSGMFAWKASTLLEEVRTHLPVHYASMMPLSAKDGTPGWENALVKAFEAVSPISVDYGIMEKTSVPIRCVASRFSWTDVGGWRALQELLPADGAGNSVRAHVKALNASGNLVFCENADEAVALIGVQDLVVVRSGNRTLVARRSDIDRLKELGEI